MSLKSIFILSTKDPFEYLMYSKILCIHLVDRSIFARGLNDHGSGYCLVVCSYCGELQTELLHTDKTVCSCQPSETHGESFQKARFLFVFVKISESLGE